MFASDLDAASRKQLARGARLTELLKQPQYTPYPVEEQTVSIWAGTNGYLDEVPVEDILRFEREFLDYLGRNSEALNTLRSTNVLDDDTVAEVTAQIEKFKSEFRTSDGKSLNEQFEALDEAEIKQEQLVVKK
jgi:F-type H+-transporting ATPase subunit alpha